MSDKKQITRTRVRYGETDKMGVAYHANYLNWFEMGRSDYCRDNGKSFAAWEKEGVLLPVVEAHCRYKSPLYYDDEIEIETSVTKLSKVSVIFSCRVLHADTRKVAAEGYTKHAFTSPDGKLLRDGNALQEWLNDILIQND